MKESEPTLPTCTGLRAFGEFAGHGACTCYGDSLVRNERERLVALAHAVEREIGVLVAPEFERLANMVIEYGPMAFNTRKTDKGVEFTVSQPTKIKDGRDV